MLDGFDRQVDVKIPAVEMVGPRAVDGARGRVDLAD